MNSRSTLRRTEYGQDTLSDARDLPLASSQTETANYESLRLGPHGRMSVTLFTTLGELKLEIFCETVPKAAENFLALCASGAYDNVLFHRNIKGFMIQTGDPTGTGKGGESIYGGAFNDEIRSTLKFHGRGIVAMANPGKADQNKSQFFITYSKQPHLDGKYTIFGRVIDGIDSTLDLMERQPVNPKNRPLKEIRLTKVQIHANPIAMQHV